MNTRFASDGCWPASLRHDTTPYEAMVKRFRANRPARVTASFTPRWQPRMTRAAWAFVQPTLPALAEYEPLLLGLVAQANTHLVEFEPGSTIDVSEDYSPDEAIALLREAEDLILDICFEPDTTLVDDILEPEDADDDEADERKAYVEALSDVAHGDYEDAMEHYDRGRHVHTTLKVATEGGMISLPEFSDAFDRPVMTSELAAASMADAEHQRVQRRLRRVSGPDRDVQSRMLSLLGECSRRRRLLQLEALNPVLARQTVEREERTLGQVKADPTVISYSAAELGQMRAAWLQAMRDAEAGDPVAAHCVLWLEARGPMVAAAHAEHMARQ